MGRYIIRRLLLTIPVLFGASFLIFMMVYALPGDPIRALAGDRPMPEAIRQAYIEEYRLDKNPVVQYFYYLGDLLRGDLGKDFAGRAVSEQIGQRFPHTFKIAIVAVIFETIVGIVAGGIAGVRQGKLFDNGVLLFTLLVVSIPVPVLAFFAQYYLGYKLGLFPISGINDGFYSYILPGLVLGATSLAYVARLTRTSVAENLRNDYVRTARAKGLSPFNIFRRHILRNSMIPVVTFIGSDLGALMGGAIITETIFNIPGIGKLVFEAVIRQEGPVVVGVTTMLVFIFIVSILLVDILTALLDPRIRYE